MIIIKAKNIKGLPKKKSKKERDKERARREKEFKKNVNIDMVFWSSGINIFPKERYRRQRPEWLSR